MAHTIAWRVGRFLERRGLLERDDESSYLAGDVAEANAIDQLLAASITYRIAVGPHRDRKVFTLQTLPNWDDSCGAEVGQVSGFSLYAGVMARADERQKRERLSRYADKSTGLWWIRADHCLMKWTHPTSQLASSEPRWEWVSPPERNGRVQHEP